MPVQKPDVYSIKVLHVHGHTMEAQVITLAGFGVTFDHTGGVTISGSSGGKYLPADQWECIEIKHTHAGPKDQSESKGLAET
jgi:hypothetical protein